MCKAKNYSGLQCNFQAMYFNGDLEFTMIHFKWTKFLTGTTVLQILTLNYCLRHNRPENLVLGFL